MPEVYNKMSPEELNPSWSAAPDQCGSCRMFRRRAHAVTDPDHYGACHLVLPNHYVQKIDIPSPKNEDGVDYRTVSDTDGCDLYRPSKKEYVQKRYWSVP